MNIHILIAISKDKVGSAWQRKEFFAELFIHERLSSIENYGPDRRLSYCGRSGAVHPSVRICRKKQGHCTSPIWVSKWISKGGDARASRDNKIKMLGALRTWSDKWLGKIRVQWGLCTNPLGDICQWLCKNRSFSNMFGLSYIEHRVLLYRNLNSHSSTWFPRFCRFRKYLNVLQMN